MHIYYGFIQLTKHLANEEITYAFSWKVHSNGLVREKLREYEINQYFLTTTVFNKIYRN